MTLAMIVAHDPNLLIGAEGGLPWKYSDDLKFFKRTTMGCPVIMGRVVFEEIGCKALPGRENIVLSRTQKYEQVTCFNSDQKAIEYLKDKRTVKAFIIGGAALYKSYLETVDELYITKVLKKYDGDTWFPEYKHLIQKGHFDQGTLLESYPQLEMWLYRKQS